MATDAKSKGRNDGGSLLVHEKLAEGKLAAVLASLSLPLSLFLQDTFTQRERMLMCSRDGTDGTITQRLFRVSLR